MGIPHLIHVSPLLVTGFDKIPSKVCGYVPRGHHPGQLNLDRVVPPGDQRHMSLASAYALAAANEALIQANWKPISEADQQRSGLCHFIIRSLMVSLRKAYCHFLHLICLHIYIFG